jgi:nitrate reductase NapE component
MFSKFEKLGFVYVGLVALLNVALFGAIVFVAWHFIEKVW